MSNTHKLSPCVAGRRFHTSSRAAERGTRRVMWITLVTMVVEIAGGAWFHSMALMADGWHMSSHALAIGLAAFAYAAARRYADDRRFAFGTWKIEVLAGFASGILLVGVAALMVFASIERLLSPVAIQYPEALAVTVLGLAVNIVCALILKGSHGHDHPHDHHGHHGHPHHAHSSNGRRHDSAEGKPPVKSEGHGHADLNLRSAYLHVLADAATSVLAIVALAGGWRFGWVWLDPAMGIFGAVLVGRWSVGLLKQTGRVLLDAEMDHPVVEEIHAAIDALGGERGPVTMTDLHVWRVGTARYACVVAVRSDNPAMGAREVRQALAIYQELVHVTVEMDTSAQDLQPTMASAM